MVLKPTFSAGRADTLFVPRLSASEREELRRRVLASPERYVAQLFVPASRTPVIAEGKLSSRALVLRCFAHANQPNDYLVMPGGLGLVASADADLAVSLSHGARSKDVWVQSNEQPPDEPTVMSLAAPIVITRGGGDLPSRTADNLYWLGRYAERAEVVSRLGRVLGANLLERNLEPETQLPLPLRRLHEALLCQTRFVGPEALGLANLQNVAMGERDLLEAVTSAEAGGSVVSALRSTLRAGRSVRDRLSYDTWRILASLEGLAAQLQTRSQREQLSSVVDELNRVVIALTGFSGVAMESMTRGFAFSFLDMGRRIERAIAQVTLLRAAFTQPAPEEGALVEAVLEVADSVMTYRRRYPAGLQVAPAVDLLLADDSNPRSVLFQLRTLQQHMLGLPTTAAGGARSQQHRLLLSATSQIELSEAIGLCTASGEPAVREGLRGLLERLGALLPSLSDSLSETYLYHAKVARHLRHGGADAALLNPWEPSR